ncbi:hypothetical protein [Pseudomonas sp. KB_12]|uniref:hypothetical protein n=1 Tax=Pseudomonas sp. KB_12 TaxID=3233034 RepID=UPI003F9849D8
MARYFKSPDSDQVEEVDAFQVLAILFLGVIYLFFAGLWRHLLIWLGILAIGLVAGPQWMAGATALLHVVYCLMIRKIVAQDYLRKGWIEVADPKAVAGN